MPKNSDIGAPAALKAIEEHELQCRNEKERLRQERDAALETMVEGDDVSERKYRQRVNAYAEALQNWDEALKRLNTFDKGVSAERREGEKITVSEAKEIFRQLILSIDLAIEGYIISLSQSAALCESPEAFHISHADNLRAAKEGALEAARRDGVLPKWIE